MLPWLQQVQHCSVSNVTCRCVFYWRLIWVLWGYWWDKHALDAVSSICCFVQSWRNVSSPETFLTRAAHLGDVVALCENVSDVARCCVLCADVSSVNSFIFLSLQFKRLCFFCEGLMLLKSTSKSRRMIDSWWRRELLRSLWDQCSSRSREVISFWHPRLNGMNRVSRSLTFDVCRNIKWGRRQKHTTIEAVFATLFYRVPDNSWKADFLYLFVLQSDGTNSYYSRCILI